MLQEMKTTETERIEVDVQDQMGTVRTLAFQGRWLVEPNEDEIIDWNMYGLALTGRGRIAVWWGAPGDPATFRDFDTLEEAEAQGVPSIVIADARAILTHSTPVVELDI